MYTKEPSARCTLWVEVGHEKRSARCREASPQVITALVGFPVVTSKITRRAGLRKTTATVRLGCRQANGELADAGSSRELSHGARCRASRLAFIDPAKAAVLSRIPLQSTKCAAICGVQLKTLGMGQRCQDAHARS